MGPARDIHVIIHFETHTMTRAPLFVTTIYGHAYAPFLAPHLQSICEAYPDAEGLVLWQDLPEDEVRVVSRAYPRFTFRRTALELGGGIHQRIPRKLHAWLAACEEHPGRPLYLLDCDTLVRKPFERLLGDGWDVVYTWKDEARPINTGVMLMRDSVVARTVLGEMAERVERIVRDPAALELAVAASGAADQHALREMIGFCNYDRDVARDVVGQRVVFRGVPCAVLNETNCREITDDLCVIHYKTGWHPILFDGSPWTVNRPKERCRAMFEAWQAMRLASDRRVTSGFVSSACARHRERYAAIADRYEERGILHSEMLAVCAVCTEMGVDTVIESGRARGQSTLTLARYFEGSGVGVSSIELMRDKDAAYAEQRLAGMPGLELLYGDSLELIPRLIEGMPGKRMAVLLDGPKGAVAIDLAKRLFRDHAGVVAIFIHDMRAGTPQRPALEEAHGRVFFTDDDAFVSSYGDLDRVCLPGDEASITMHTWRPHMKGHDAIGSYGPTLGVLLRDTQRVPQRVVAAAAA